MKLRILAIGIFLLMILSASKNLYVAFGSGPPYFSQTANMDKWKSPYPLILYTSILPLSIVILLLIFSFRKR